MKTRLEEHYLTAVRPALVEKFDKNPHAGSQIQKVVLNMGVGSAVRDSKKIEHAVSDMTAIAVKSPLLPEPKGKCCL